MFRFGSHGRLSILKIFLMVSVLSAFTLILGATLALEWNQKLAQTHEMAQLDQARVQNQLLLQSFWAALDRLKLETAQFTARNQSPGPVLFPQSILHWSQLELKAGLIPTVKRSIRNPEWPLPNFRSTVPGSGFESQYLQSVIHVLSEPGVRSELSQDGFRVIEVREDPELKPRYLAFAFKLQPAREHGLQPALSTADSPELKDRVDLVLVDPVDAFPIFRDFSKLLQENSYRAYLLSTQGIVLAHSNTSYLNSDFSGLQVFKKGIHELQIREPAGVAGAGTYRAVDHLSALSSYTQLGKLPLYAVIEKVKARSDLELGQIWSSFKNHVVECFFLLLAWAAAAFSFAIWISRHGGPEKGKEKGIEKRIDLKSEVELDLPSLDPEKPVANARGTPAARTKTEVEVKAVDARTDAELYRHIQQAATEREKVATEKKVQIRNQEQLLLDRFESDVFRLRSGGDTRAISEKMTAVAAKICRSPTLYFTYQESTRLAILSSDAGFDLTHSLGDAPTTLTFPVTADALDQMIRGDKLGEWITLSEYRPLGRAILSKLGIAHFEAWAVMGEPGRGRLMGVLVVLQSGVDSNFHQDSLGRMVRTAGLGYTQNHEAPELTAGQKPRQAQEAPEQKVAPGPGWTLPGNPPSGHS